MSYIARLAERSGAATTGVHSPSSVTPALRSDSPLAAFDQRFNLQGFSAIPSGGSFASFDGPEDIEIEDDLAGLDAEFAPAPASAHAWPLGAFAPAPSAKAVESSSETPGATHAPSTAGVEQQLAVRTDVAPGRPVEAERARMLATPSFPQARSDELKKVASPLVAGLKTAAVQGEARGDVPAGVTRPAALVAPAAPSLGRSGPIPTTPGAAAPARQPGAPAPPFEGALQSALARVEAWMRNDTAPRPVEAAHSAPERGALAHAGFAVGAPIAAPQAAPRLNIGHIEVEVVAPPAPAPKRAPRVTQVSAPAARFPSGERLGRLTFGMRQR